jgi:hypothetical protein
MISSILNYLSWLVFSLLVIAQFSGYSEYTTIFITILIGVCLVHIGLLWGTLENKAEKSKLKFVEMSTSYLEDRVNKNAGLLGVKDRDGGYYNRHYGEYDWMQWNNQHVP